VRAENRAFLDEFYRKRVQTLQSVDELICDVFKQLEDNGVLDNTIVVFTSDNGFHLGKYNMMAGKETCYEEDIKTPIFAAGPGIGRGVILTAKTSHIDIAPTLAK
jgi:N-acetylglucosamine-6-sulfatase